MINSDTLVRVLNDERVLRVLEIALRDEMIRSEYGRMESKAQERIEVLATKYFLSEERIRSIVYRK